MDFFYVQGQVLKYLVTIFTPIIEVFIVTTSAMRLKRSNFRTLVVTLVTFEFLKNVRFHVMFEKACFVLTKTMFALCDDISCKYNSQKNLAFCALLSGVYYNLVCLEMFWGTNDN